MPNDWPRAPQLKPVLAGVPPVASRPAAGTIPPKKKWAFSFRYWKQIRHFGVDPCQKGWFISLLLRLSELSDNDLEEFRGSYAVQSSVRFHAIDWAARSIPLARKDIDWLGDYGSEDTDLVQFHISKALGRVIGFFDENDVFQIVLLDPLHNLQPAKDFGYRVRATHIGACELTSLSIRFERAISRAPLGDEDRKAMLAALRNENTEYFGAAVLLDISEAHLAKAYDYVARGAVVHLGEMLQLTIDEFDA